MKPIKSGFMEETTSSLDCFFLFYFMFCFNKDILVNLDLVKSLDRTGED